MHDYNEALPCYHICKGAKGIAAQRMAISKYFDEDDFIVSMDDDLEEIYRDKTPYKRFRFIYCIYFLKDDKQKPKFSRDLPYKQSIFF